MLIQALGFVGFTIYALSFQLLKPRHTILTQASSNIFNIFHFWGLGAVMVTFIATIATVRDVGNGLGDDRIKKTVSVVFLVALCVGAFFLAQSWYDYCAVIGSVAMTLAQYARDNFYRYRFLCFGHQSMWLVVFLMIGSLAGLIFMSCILTSNIVGIVRYNIHKKYVKY